MDEAFNQQAKPSCDCSQTIILTYFRSGQTKRFEATGEVGPGRFGRTDCPATPP
jgi:hypothetical protein